MTVKKLILLAAMSATVGCGSDMAPDQRVVFPAMGSITFQGKAIPDATVRLHPVTPPSDGKPVYVSRGQVDDSGLFSVSTYGRDDGAPPGEYRVAISWLGPLTGLSEDEEDRLIERLPRKYTSPDTSGITVVVAEDVNILPEIVIN